MESTINKMLPFAIKAINEKKEIHEGEKIKGIYESYLSQFGPMANQILLRSTLAVYKNKAGGSKGNRMFILDLIYFTIKESQTMQIIEKNPEIWINKYLSITSEVPDNDSQLILDASVSLKRAIRTFLLTDNKID